MKERPPILAYYVVMVCVGRLLTELFAILLSYINLNLHPRKQRLENVSKNLFQ